MSYGFKTISSNEDTRMNVTPSCNPAQPLPPKLPQRPPRTDPVVTRTLLIACLLALPARAPAYAEVTPTKVPLGAGGFGVLPLLVMQRHALIERPAAQAASPSPPARVFFDRSESEKDSRARSVQVACLNRSTCS